MGQPCGETGLQELQNCTNWAVECIELAVSKQRIESFHFKAYSFLVEGALGWRTISTTSVERPEAMRFAPLEVMSITSTPPSWMSQREPEGTVRCLPSNKQVHLSLAKLSKFALPWGEASTPRASAPASTGCLLPHSDAQEYELFSARGVCPGTTQGSGAPACTEVTNADLLGGWYRRPPLCCRCAPTHDDLLIPGESV